MLAAYGSGAAKTSHDRGMTILNIDIGGGTTKLALVERGNVVRTAALHMGGRLAVFDDQGRLTRLDPAGQRLATLAGVDWTLGAKVTDEQIERVTNWMADALVAALTAGGSDTVASEIGKAWGRSTFLVTTLAAYVPALRASRIEPTRALRWE